MDDHSRYSVADTAARAPGVDWITKSPNGPLIDTGVDIVFGNRGRLYLAVETVREMAEFAGLFNEDTEREAVKYDLAYEAGRKAAVEENLHGHLDRIIAELDAATGSLRRALVPDGPDEAEPEPEPAPAPAEPAVVDTAESVQPRARRSTRQGNGPALDERPADVPAGPSHEPFGI